MLHGIYCFTICALELLRATFEKMQDLEMTPYYLCV